MVRRRRRRGRRAHDGGGHEDEERWLLTYADMITLLMALFMVLFSISSVNVSKLRVLHDSLHDAFSGKILPGGRSIEETGAVDNVKKMETQPPAIHQVAVATTLAAEQKSFETLKRAVDEAARREGVAPKVSTRITERGLAIDILTDGLLFDSAEATVKPAGLALLHRLAPVLGTQPGRRVAVEGHTDSEPIHSGTFPSNWELSGARASAVVRALVADRLAPERFEATGRAYLDPVASNATGSGRARNRRVEILLLRNASGGAS